jgi:hypothetical protein
MLEPQQSPDHVFKDRETWEMNDAPDQEDPVKIAHEVLEDKDADIKSARRATRGLLKEVLRQRHVMAIQNDMMEDRKPIVLMVMVVLIVSLVEAVVLSFLMSHNVYKSCEMNSVYGSGKTQVTCAPANVGQTD